MLLYAKNFSGQWIPRFKFLSNDFVLKLFKDTIRKMTLLAPPPPPPPFIHLVEFGNKIKHIRTNAFCEQSNVFHILQHYCSFPVSKYLRNNWTHLILKNEEYLRRASLKQNLLILVKKESLLLILRRLA